MRGHSSGMKRYTAAAAIIALVATTGLAASATDFYISLLNRGVTDYNAGRDAAAARELRIAAFGLIDSIEHYQTAEIYLALVTNRLGQEANARSAAEDVVAAEGVQRRYASLKIPQPVRTAFESLVGKILGSDQLAILRGSAAPASAKPTKPIFTPVQPQQTPPVVPDAPKPTQPQPQSSQPQPKPQTVTPTPAPQRATPPPAIEAKPKADPPKPAPPKPAPQKPAPQATTTPAPKPATTAPVVAAPKVNVQTRLDDGERALRKNALTDARSIYHELLEVKGIDHPTMLLVAEGLYRSRDFGGVVRAFELAGALNRGEEPYRYYLAVAMYETGDYRGAKRELAAALPYIEVTGDVARYRAKIDGAIF